jgi:tetratricopeptide (TPR) repeat protein
MFEVLLQADKALASGDFDQAERAFWQLIELDPTNAIAVAGLARVSLERGDQRLARTFANRALVLDPDSIAARQILEVLSGERAGMPASGQPDQTMSGAQRLEELGQRRRSLAEGGAQTGGDPDDADLDADDAAPAESPPSRPPGGEAAPARYRPGTREGTSRLGVARPKIHQALGERARRHLQPEDLKPQSRADDPFAAAESAAAIEAVDATDDLVIDEPVGRRRPAEEADPDLAAIEATGEDESIALRLALIPEAATPEAPQAAEAATASGPAPSVTRAPTQAELDAAAAEAIEVAKRDAADFELDELEVAEMMAGQVLQARAREIDLDAIEADLQAAERRAAPDYRAAEPVEPAEPARPAPKPTEPTEPTEPAPEPADAPEKPGRPRVVDWPSADLAAPRRPRPEPATRSTPGPGKKSPEPLIGAETPEATRKRPVPESGTEQRRKGLLRRFRGG